MSFLEDWIQALPTLKPFFFCSHLLNQVYLSFEVSSTLTQSN